jgi:myo-inositol-1-phosphate synthase
MKIKAFRDIPSIILLVAGAKGAVGSTTAAAISALGRNPEAVLPYLTTCRRFSNVPAPAHFEMAGWDINPHPLEKIIEQNGILPDSAWKKHLSSIRKISIRNPLFSGLKPVDRIRKLMADIEDFKKSHPGSYPVFINLLPAGRTVKLKRLEDLYRMDPELADRVPDLFFAVAAAESRIPVVNFTPNLLMVPGFAELAQNRRIPIAGRDGKTGQTYLKVVLASALKERFFEITGWYSLNLLGNADGKNLMDPEKAAGKLANKTSVLDAIFSNSEQKREASPFHKVHIDFYPPRGDAKEAWDVIDFSGMFGLPMSLRLNLLGRDSILAAPLVLDLARWMVILNAAGFSGPIPRLGFYFKMPEGKNPPLSFQDQTSALDRLEAGCLKRLATTERG